MPDESPKPVDPPPRGRLTDVNGWFLSGALIIAIAVFFAVMNQHYAVGDWLAWRYLVVLALAAVWAGSCLSGGYFLLDRVRGKKRDGGLEDAALAFPLGAFAFQLAIFLLGLAHLLGVVAFVLLPLAFAYAGGRHMLVVSHKVRALGPPRSFGTLSLSLLGAVGVALLYFQILSPEGLHWDARWYHLPIAQHYALWGAVRPFPEGWWLGAYPQSASLIYTWAFLLPGGLLFDRLELCLHLELAVFMATMLSIPTLVRALAPELRARAAWAAIFLFPGVFLYDSNLSGAADHFAALWCIPFILALINVWRTWSVPNGLLFGIFAAAILDSKFSAWSMLLAPGGLFVVRALWLARTTKAGGQLGGPASRAVSRTTLVSLGAILLFSAEHWLKNWIWYGDPIYPHLHKWLHVHPFTSESPAMLRLQDSFNSSPRPGWQGVWDALQATVTFSFLPNDWPVFHRNVPVFGSLFTLSMLCLPFVRARMRLWLAYLGVLVAIFAWYLLSHQDRYLQAWLPCMAACAIATLGLAWNRGERAVRTLVVLLITAQIIWGGDVAFFPTHNLIKDSPIRQVVTFLASGFLRTPNRFRLFGDEGVVAERLPKDAVLLLHELNTQIGFDANTVSDQWQGLLSYAELGSPAAIGRAYRGLRITHLIWSNRLSPWNSIGSDLAFMGFALNHTSDVTQIGEFQLARWDGGPAGNPPFNDRVLMLGCGQPYASGMYRLGNLTVPEPGVPWASPEAPVGDLAKAIAGAGFVAFNLACGDHPPAELMAPFHPPVSRADFELYVRRDQAPHAAAEP